MEPGSHAGGASDRLAADSSLTVEPVPALIPQAGFFELDEPGTDDETSVCVLEPISEVAIRTQEAAMAEDQRMREMADAMYSPEWIAAIHRGILEQAYLTAAATSAANPSAESSEGAYADPAVVDEPAQAASPPLVPLRPPATTHLMTRFTICGG